MERVIDRKEYRRKEEYEKEATDATVVYWQQKIRKVTLQALISSIILLVFSFLKFFHCKEILEIAKQRLEEEINFASFKENGQMLFNNATNYYKELNNVIERFVNQENNNLINLTASGDEDEKISFVTSTIESGEVIIEAVSDSLETNYETAVEGINQMSQDAEIINQKYPMKVPVIGTITSRFGVRNSDNPIVSNYHSGLDIAANTGTQIIAALDGEVLEASTDTYFGKYLKIKKDNITIIYAHCSKLLAKKGDKIKRGELIAYVGNTGNSTGPHLHFEIKYEDRLVNPEDVLKL